MIVPPAPTLLSPPAQCQCCTNRTLVLEDVCLEHSAGLLSLLRAGGAAGGTLESLHFEQCHLVAAGLAPPAGDAGEEQEQALEELAFLVVKECYGEDWDGGIEPALAELLSQAPELVGLTIKDSAVSSAVLPDLLEGLQLDSLALEGCGLESFPPFEGLEGEAGRGQVRPSSWLVERGGVRYMVELAACPARACLAFAAVLPV